MRVSVSARITKRTITSQLKLGLILPIFLPIASFHYEITESKTIVHKNSSLSSFTEILFGFYEITFNDAKNKQFSLHEQ